MKFLISLAVFLLLTSTSLATTVSDMIKMSVYEIYNPAVKASGTGFIVKDSLLGNVLVTCKHVVQESNGNYVDSIFVRRNRFLPTGEAISDTSKFVVRLKADGNSYLVEHPNPDVDLVMLPVAYWNTTLSSGDSFGVIPSSSVLDKDRLNKKGIDEGFDVEVIGFSFSWAMLPENKFHYHFSRFGKIGLYTPDEVTLIIDKRYKTANFILLDMSIRPGDSGSPVVVYANKTPYLMGFIAATQMRMEYGIAYPVYYLYELMDRMKTKIRTRKTEK
jgi:hypothetical protein